MNGISRAWFKFTLRGFNAEARELQGLVAVVRYLKAKVETVLLGLIASVEGAICYGFEGVAVDLDRLRLISVLRRRRSAGGFTLRAAATAADHRAGEHG